ncbi:unnamed protein product [Schistosoma margrebowiei]|uniref:Uncharacterized protein n=1 Tax=Schistosoma margrebowiei TaxID=48269 RepID=A0A183N0K1_9TREM|nr:unnamed protein product [Schistosoma margrebowiei]
MEHGILVSFAAFPFESYMRKIRCSVHCGFAAAKQAAQRCAEEVYFQSILNQDMADNVTEPEVTDDSSKQMVSYRNSKLSTARLDNVVIAKSRPGTVKRKHKDYLCTSEELEVAEVEAGFAQVEFPVVNILTENLSPIARFVSTYQLSYSSSSKPDLLSPPIPRTSTEGDKPTLSMTVLRLRKMLLLQRNEKHCINESFVILLTV